MPDFALLFSVWQGSVYCIALSAIRDRRMRTMRRKKKQQGKTEKETENAALYLPTSIPLVRSAHGLGDVLVPFLPHFKYSIVCNCPLQ
ncbi:hypothetical protein QBC37DRAFT_416057 [Rhypophila decipiens]|uniref:Uncharacterized protein n=1 Tax=Rhypophila decipiens TaxID=261697 RepID=A0AAN6YCT1_9PEZI|nr:hypothetical protein QBC37DRAFT_416057 [Rhypophila decipiens]